ncbi:hypothetical protein [Acidovorax sp. SUPP2539]|uniref:hypothetical protein n=1 Tax=Acidovorax sp. SUPP2539 TaxID=2920878 RepID=UPI0023DE6588|nr:hypothetical protein [Acidovorax sp. SUPP2539]GKS91902.1 hypothetical protein AVTE2539_21075 [Acidovorax sp. SUPP2539]
MTNASFDPAHIRLSSQTAAASRWSHWTLTLYKLANLSVRKRRKAKRISGELQSLAASRRINETWSTDFVMDTLINGRRIKCHSMFELGWPLTRLQVRRLVRTRDPFDGTVRQKLTGCPAHRHSRM